MFVLFCACVVCKKKNTKKQKLIKKKTKKTQLKDTNITYKLCFIYALHNLFTILTTFGGDLDVVLN